MVCKLHGHFLFLYNTFQLFFRCDIHNHLPTLRLRQIEAFLDSVCVCVESVHGSCQRHTTTRCCQAHQSPHTKLIPHNPRCRSFNGDSVTLNGRHLDFPSFFLSLYLPYFIRTFIQLITVRTKTNISRYIAF